MTPSEAIKHGASKGLHVAWRPDMKLLIVAREQQKVDGIELLADAITIAEHEGLWFLTNMIRLDPGYSSLEEAFARAEECLENPTLRDQLVQAAVTKLERERGG